MKYCIVIYLCILAVLPELACTKIRSMETQEYENELNRWKAARIERLKNKTGWLNLAGLYWLKDGDNTFGSDSSNSIVFPSNTKAFYGIFFLKGDTILLNAFGDSDIRVDSKSVRNMIIISDEGGNPSLMESGNIAWYIIKREGRYGIRLRDYNHPRIASLDHIPHYDASLEWKITADFIPCDSVRKIETVTVTGRTDISNCPGELVFRKGYKKYRLLPILEGKELFIIFADKTNGIETYGNGRFLYANLPDSSDKVILDFNKAYNPPCALTPFATCPMPPKENILDLSVEAGEKEIHF